MGQTRKPKNVKSQETLKKLKQVLTENPNIEQFRFADRVKLVASTLQEFDSLGLRKLPKKAEELATGMLKFPGVREEILRALNSQGRRLTGLLQPDLKPVSDFSLP